MITVVTAPTVRAVTLEEARQQLRLDAHDEDMLLAIHHLVETVFFGDSQTPHGPLFVTHVYSRGAHGWRLVSRHASAAGDESSGQEHPECSAARILH